MQRSLFRSASRAAALIALSMLSATALAEPSNKWRIEFDETAQSAGKIVLNVLPSDGSPILIEVSIPAGTRENDVARIVGDSLKESLGSGYNIEIDDGEDVLIKQDGAGLFDLRLVSSSVTGVEIELERE